ncbi:MAG: hypothetical protein ACYCZJ_13370 [Sulfuriferula sp.]
MSIAEACARHYEDQQNAADRMDAEIQARVPDQRKLIAADADTWIFRHIEDANTELAKFYRAAMKPDMDSGELAMIVRGLVDDAILAALEWEMS